MSCARLLLLAPVFSAGLTVAATFGTVVPIGGHASDIALDEKRGVLYIANFTANQIDVMSLRTNTIQRSINVARQPSAIALSRDGRWLAITHYGHNEGESAASHNTATFIDLNENSRREFPLSAPPLGVAFGFDDRAFLVTARDFVRVEPVTGHVQTIAPIRDVVSKALPAELATFPPDITQASVSASGDGRFIYGIAEKIAFQYDVLTGGFGVLSWAASPDLGPRTLSVASDGSYYVTGWWVIDPAGYIKASFGDPSGEYETGTHAVDTQGGIIYSQVPKGTDKTAPPVLQVVAADNLQVFERIQLPENLTGRAVLNASRDTMYSASDSGVVVLPVGRLNAAPRVRAAQSMLVFRSNGCNREMQTQELVIDDPGGNRTTFLLEPKSPGISVSPGFGVTPAVVRVTVDPGAFPDRGTGVADIVIHSAAAVNVVDPVRVHVNNRTPDQRGTMVSVPGKLVDLLADPLRNRVYILRQDTHEVLVFNSATHRQTGTLRTGTNPMHMAVTQDGRYLLVANDRSQFASVFNLDTMEAERPVVFPSGHFPRSIGVSGNAILAVSRVTGGPAPGMIDRIDLSRRIATTPATLGVYKNDVSVDSVLAATPNGSSVLLAMPNGNVMLYDANKDTFAVSRKDFQSLSGGYGASNWGLFAVDNNLLNGSLVPVGKLENNGRSSGLMFVDQTGFRTNSTGSSAPGTISRLDIGRGTSVLPTSLTESPLLANEGKFIRTLAALPNRSAMVSLSTTGFTVLPWNYDAAFAPPRIERVVSAADRSDSIAPGGLVSILGRDLSPFNVSTDDPTLADALPEACLTVNGTTAPIIFASPERVNAQLPFNAGGPTTLILRTPGGASDSFRLRVATSAPTVFRSGTAGPETGLPAVIRAVNNDLVTLSNPIHPGDEIVIYATGLGRTNPEVPAGTPAPYEPLARAVETPQVQLGGVDLNVFYAGLTPGLVGVYQINALVPLNVPTGFDIPLSVGRGEHITTLNVRVVR